MMGDDFCVCEEEELLNMKYIYIPIQSNNSIQLTVCFTVGYVHIQFLYSSFGKGIEKHV